MNKLCNTSNVYSWSIVIFRYVPFQFSHGRMDVTSSISTIYILFVPSWEGCRYSIRSNTVNAHRCSNLYRLEPLFRNRVRCKYRTAIHTEDSIEKKDASFTSRINCILNDLQFRIPYIAWKIIVWLIIDACLLDEFYTGAKKISRLTQI